MTEGKQARETPTHNGSSSAAEEAAQRQTKVRELFAVVAKNCELPPLPAVAMRAMTLARDPDTEAAELSHVVASDAALSARVLRISRSVLYVRRHSPRTLKDAVMTVGFQALRKILITASARAVYEKSDAVTEALWNHALATALACEDVTKGLKLEDGGWGFVCGLLHDIGKQILRMSDGETFQQLWIDVAEGKGTFGELEKATFGVEHALVGASLASQWGLDEELAEGILFHHKPDELPDTALPALVCLADHIVYRAGLGGAPGALPPPIPEGVLAMDDEGLEAAAVRTRETFEKEKALFL